MAKSKEELQEIKNSINELKVALSGLTRDELAQVLPEELIGGELGDKVLDSVAGGGLDLGDVCFGNCH